MAAPVATKAPFMAGSVIWQKKGPLPVWAWALILLSVIFVVTWWRRNRAAAESGEASTGGYTGFYRDELPGDQGAPPIFIVPPAATPPVNVGPFPITVNPPATVPTAPPGGGAPPPTTQIPASAEAPKGTNLYQWLESLNNQHPGLNADFGKLDLYNPGWRSKGLYWVQENPNYKTPYLKAPLTLRLR